MSICLVGNTLEHNYERLDQEIMVHTFEDNNVQGTAAESINLTGSKANLLQDADTRKDLIASEMITW